MASVTRWKDNKCTDIKTVLNTITENKDKNDYKSELMVISGLETRQILKDDKTIIIRGEEVEFNVIRYNYNQINKENPESSLPIEERTTRKSGYVVVYTRKASKDSHVRYIINRNSDALKVLRLLLNYTGKKEITKEQPILQSDMFIWLIKRIYSDENDIDLGDDMPTLHIDNLTGFRGQTEDETNRVSANGDTIMKIISTLSFLLESNNIKQIKFSLTYENHENIELLFSENVIGTNVKNYSGSFEDDRIRNLNNEDNDLVIESEIYLLCYLAIIPEITQAYTESIEEEEWSLEIHKKFLEEVANHLQSKIEYKVLHIAQQ